MSDIVNQKTTKNNKNFDVGVGEENLNRKKDWKRKPRVTGFCIFCLLMSVLLLSMLVMMSGTVDKSDEAKNLMETGTSKIIVTGTILATSDSDNIKIYKTWTVHHNYNGNQARMWIWDYAAEDGDYVQIIVNGTPVGEAFMIKHKPVEFMIPSDAIVQVRGIHDGDGRGITYAVHFEVNDSTICNRTTMDAINTYTLVKSP